MKAVYEGDLPGVFYRGKTFPNGVEVEVDAVTAGKLECRAGWRVIPDEDELPTLHNRKKAELIEIAEAEGVEVDESMTNKAIREAIEAAR